MNDAYVGCDLPSLEQQLVKVRTHLLLSELLFLSSEALGLGLRLVDKIIW